MGGIFSLLQSEQSTAKVSTIVGFFDGVNKIIHEDHLQGVISNKEEADGWFFDPYFIPNESNQSLSSMKEEEKAKMWSKPFKNVLKELK